MEIHTKLAVVAIIVAGAASLTGCGGGGGGGGGGSDGSQSGSVLTPSRSLRPMANDEVVPVWLQVRQSDSEFSEFGTGKSGETYCSSADLECFPRIRSGPDAGWFDSDRNFVLGEDGHWSNPSNYSSGQWRATYDGSMRVNNGRYNRGAQATVNFQDETYDLRGESLGAGGIPDETEISLTGVPLAALEGEYPDGIDTIISKAGIDRQRIDGRLSQIDAGILRESIETLMDDPSMSGPSYDLDAGNGNTVTAMRDENGVWRLPDVIEFQRRGQNLLVGNIKPHSESRGEAPTGNLGVGDQSAVIQLRSDNLFTDDGERFLANVRIESEADDSFGVRSISFHTAEVLGMGIEIDVAGEASGTVIIDLFDDMAPMHAERITALARAGAYDGVAFHRVIEGFMAQTGDVRCGVAVATCQAGTGGSAMPNLNLEISDLEFDRGMVGMARGSALDSANSQFFITFADRHHLNGQYTVVGRVTSGMNVVDGIKRGLGGNGAVLGEPDRMIVVRATE